jgi:hypothetical protein
VQPTNNFGLGMAVLEQLGGLHPTRFQGGKVAPRPQQGGHAFTLPRPGRNVLLYFARFFKIVFQDGMLELFSVVLCQLCRRLAVCLTHNWLQRDGTGVGYGRIGANMPFRIRMPSSALVLLAVSCLLPFVLEAESQWLEVRSPHFSVVTDAGERRGREVAIRFEQMRAVFAALMTKANVNLPVPLQIVAFRNTKEMRQFVPLWNGKPIQAAGLFQGGEDRTFILLVEWAARATPGCH